jgi:hypothetical protein
MSRCRIHVENCFGKISNLWQSHQMPSRLQSLNSPVAAYYIVAVLLTNIFTCIRGNETIFGLKPPSLHDYLHPQGESFPPSFLRSSLPPIALLMTLTRRSSISSRSRRKPTRSSSPELFTS